MENNAVESDFGQALGERQTRRVYLITYSQADLGKIANCQAFADCILEAFSQSQGNQKDNTNHPEHWSCCMEEHRDGGKHYHLAIKLSAPRRWKAVKNYVSKKHGIALHFSDQSCGYHVAYKYVCKNKSFTDVLHSLGHPNLQEIGSPKTKRAFTQFSDNAKKRRISAPTNNEKIKENLPSSSKPKKLSNIDVSEFIVANDIRSDSELMVVAKTRHSEGEKDLYKFIINKSSKSLSELLDMTWKMNDASKNVQRAKESRISILRAHLESECLPLCNGEWLVCAKQVLHQNGINLYYFASALRQLLERGRQKRLNVLLIGPTNCGKSFLLNPLELIYKTFINPATGKYAWVGLEECEVAYLNDFRWSPELIEWSDFLLLLEGQTVHLPRPKNMFATDLCIPRENTIPIFATSKGPIEFWGKYNSRDERENDMMSSRWNIFKFSVQIPSNE
ncbi:hypothetical protein DSY43_02735, partial [Paramuricea clavata]